MPWRPGIWLVSVHSWRGFHFALGCLAIHKGADAAPTEGTTRFLGGEDLLRISNIVIAFRATNVKGILIRDKKDVRSPLRNFA
ncbi:hypothetical protein EDD17DRAFT_408931 [Pisolithus thermaeus]|nr:hypothetical protein EDD17DRAFT_408931 [Pisolithus thermaeus]